jgi:hypothetical protein
MGDISGDLPWCIPLLHVKGGCKSKVKTMLIVFFNAKGVVHKEFVPQGQTVNTTYYVEVLDKLRNRVVHTRNEITATWQLHHDNAPATLLYASESFWPRTAWQCCPSPLTVLTWLRQTSLCS